MVVRKGLGEDSRGQMRHHEEDPENLLFSIHMEVRVLHQTDIQYTLTLHPKLRSWYHACDTK